MLQNVTIPASEIAGLKPTHLSVLAGLLCFVDRIGCCWPGMRKLAAVCGMTLSRVQRAVAEMEELGYLTRRRRGTGTLYRIAQRFLWRPIRRPASDTESPASRTEGEARKEEQQDLKKEDRVRRAAPPAPAAEGPNPHARRQWLRTLNSFISERLSGAQQWLGWELVAKAEQGALIDRVERRQLDDIDRAMRSCGYRPGGGAAERAAATGALRNAFQSK